MGHKYPNLSAVNYRIRRPEKTLPIYIQFWCPYCETENWREFDEQVASLCEGNPHWLKYKILKCEKCHSEIEMGDF